MQQSPKKTSQNGVALIKRFEGLRLNKYQDCTGKWTIGYGHLIKCNETFNNILTQEEALVLLLNDIQETEKEVLRVLTPDVNQNQFDALISFTFNLGIKNLENSTLLMLVNQGQYQLAGKQFLRWNLAGGHICDGLTKRRKAESALFLRPL